MATIDSVKLPDNSTYDLTDNYSGYQTETLATPITVDGTSETTVEGALGAVNDYADKIKGSMSNENFVDNPFFTINERGVTGGTIASYTPIVDRWRVDKGTGSPTWALGANGITLTPATGSYAYIYQYVRNATELNGKTVTISVKLADGTIVSTTFVRTSGTNQSDTKNDVTMRFNSDEAIRIYANNGAEKTFRAIKLELGSISTLANDIAPDYASELAKCQTSTADPSDTYANQGQLMTSTLQGVYGAKNLLQNTGGSETTYGVTFTMNDDGSVSTSGKCTRTDNFAYHTINYVLNPKAGTYLLTGAPPTGTYATYALTATLTKSDNSTESFIDYGNGVVITIPSGAKSIYFTIRCYYNVVVDGLTFYPMLRDARVIDPTFAPFAETNLQLTQNKAERDDLSTIHATGSTNTTGVTITNGTFFYLNGQFCKALTNIAVNATFTENTNYKKDTVGEEIKPVATFKYGAVKSLSATIQTEIENSFTNAANYSMFSGSTSGDTEGGWYGFKHTDTKYCHMIFFDRSGIYAITRASDGTYTKNVIFENN